MKKLFFLVAAIALGWLSSSAEKYTYANWATCLGLSQDGASLNAGQEYTSTDGNFKIQFSNGATLYGSSYKYALQPATGTFTITAVNGNLKSINFDSSTYHVYSKNAFESVSSGEMTFNGATVWTGDAKSITITTNAPSFYSTNLEIETGAGGSVNPDPAGDATSTYASWADFFGSGSEGKTLLGGETYTSADGKFKFQSSVEDVVNSAGRLTAKQGSFTITAINGNLKSIDFGSYAVEYYGTSSLTAATSGSLSEDTGTLLWKCDTPVPSVTFTVSMYSLDTKTLEIVTGEGGGTVDPTPDPVVTSYLYDDGGWGKAFGFNYLGGTLAAGEDTPTADGKFKINPSVDYSVNGSGRVTALLGTFTLTSTIGNMTEINFGNYAKQYYGLGSIAANAVSSGAMSIESVNGSDCLVWKGNAASVTFTVAGQAMYSRDLIITTVEGGGDTPVDPVEKPEVSFDWDGKTQYSGNTVSFSACPANQVINFKAKNLKGDITLVCTSNITPATTTIAKAQAEAADGFDVNFYFDPKVKGEDATVTVKTEGMDDAVLSFSSLYAKMTVTIDKFSGVTSTGTYNFTGEGLVTFHQTKKLGNWSAQGYAIDDANIYYIEDETGAVALTIPEGTTVSLKEGDKVGGFKFTYTTKSGVKTYTLQDAAPTVVSSNNALVPAEITVSQLAQYCNRLVTLKDVTSTSAGKTFSNGSFYNLSQNGVDKTYVFGIFPDTDMVGFVVPEGTFTLNGIAYNGGYIYPRTTADVVTGGTPVEAPELTIERNGRPVTSSILLSGYAPMVKDVVVKGKNLTGDVTLSCDNEYVSFDKTTLAKADVESEAGATVAITVNPAESGDFKATVKFATAGLDTPAEVTLDTSWSSINVIKKVEKLSEVINKAGTYQVTNDPVTVTYSNWDMYYVYAQNADVALRLDVAAINYGAPADKVLKAGDEIKNFFLLVTAPTEWEPNWTYAINTTDPTTGIPDSYGENRHYYDFVSRDNVVTPEVITLDQAAAKANRLVKVTGVQFQNLTDGQKFELTDGAEEWMPKEPTAYAVKAGGKDGFVKPFDGEIYGTEIPTGAVSVTGIAAADATVMPYNLTCIEAGAPVGDAELNLSTTTIAMTGQKMPCERKVVLTGKDLTGDVTVKCPEGVTATPATVAAADINAAGTEGVEVTLTFDIAAKTFEGTVEFECADLDAPKTIAVTGAALIPQLRAEDVAGVKALGQDGNVIMLTGEATVTYVVKNNDGKVTSFYMQDENRAMLVDTEGLLMMGKDFPQPAIGDKLKDVVVSPYDGDFSLIANGLGQYLTIVSSGNTVATKKVAGEAALTEEDEYMLLEVENARFDVPEGTTVLEEGGLYTLKSATGEITVNPFKSANGTAIPDSRVNVIGIYAPDSSIPGYLVLRPRTSADVTTSAAGDVPTAIVTRTFYDPKAIAVGETATIAQYTVEVDNLTADGTVTFEGEGADQFTAEPATISKEKGKKTLTVKFTPKATGTFDVKMNINFGVEELNQSLELTGKAYDPANLPEVTLSEYKLQLNAKVGETATQKVMMTMKNCFAPVTITAKDAENTSVTLNTMSVEPSAEPFELVVTYAPTAEGQGTQMFDITTDQIKTVAVLVVNFSTDNSIAIVPADADGYYRVYNTNGVMLLETRDASRLAELTPGLYIINGKKVIIR